MDEGYRTRPPEQIAPRSQRVRRRRAGWPRTGSAVGLGLAALALCGGGARAAGPAVGDASWQRLEVVGHLGGAIQALATYGSTAWIAQGDQLLAYDIADPAAARLVGGIRIAPPARRLVAAGSHVFALNDRGLVIVAAADPARPALVGHFAPAPPESEPEGLAVIGPRAFLTVGQLLYVVDVQDPTQPTAMGTLRSTSGAYGLLAVDGRQLVALRSEAAGQVVATIDVSDPRQPRELGAVQVPELYARSLAAGGGHAYALDALSATVRAIDLSDPARPALAWQTGSPNMPMAVAWAPDRLYVAGISADLALFDLSEPDRPVLAGLLNGSGSRTMVASGGPGALVASDSSVTLAAVADGPALVAAGQINPPQAGPVESVAVRDGLAYTTGYGQGLGILDIRDPATPRELAELRIEGVAGIALSGTTAYLAGAVFHSVDVTTPASPTDLGMVEFSITPWERPRLAVSGRHVLVASSSAQLWMVDARDPRAPAVVPWNDTEPLIHAQDIAVSGAVAFGVHEIGQFVALDVADPAHPTVLSQIDVPATAIETRDGFAYMAGSSGMIVAHVADPRAPVVVARLPWLKGYATDSDIILGDHTAYVLHGVDTFQVAAVDIRDPRAPRVVGNVDLGRPTELYRTWSLAWSDGQIYVAGASDGLWIIRPTPTAPAVQVFLPAAFAH